MSGADVLGNRRIRPRRAGGGIQASTFYNEIWGFGARAFWWDGELNIQHDYSLSVIARFPIRDLCIAPYIYGGPGVRANGDAHFAGHLGGGLDMRLSRFDCVGIFVDVRHTWTASGHQDYTTLTGGVRFSY